VSSIATTTKRSWQNAEISMETSLNIAALRGGASKAGRQIRGKKPMGAIVKMKEWISTIQPVSRVYVFLALFCSLVHMVGLPAPSYFSLDVGRFYELWRPFTAVSYLGPPSMSMANNIFFLLRFGQTLEAEQGSGPYAWYLLVQTTILTLLGWLLGYPFLSQSMISSIIHVCSRMSPMDQIPFQFGLVITSWQLPFCMMAIDCLSQQSIQPAWPHLLGIFSGHVYLFATKIWPALGGKARLQPPEWILRWLGEKPSSNVPELNFKQQKLKRELLQKQQEQLRREKREKRNRRGWLGSIFGSSRKSSPSRPSTMSTKTAPSSSRPSTKSLSNQPASSKSSTEIKIPLDSDIAMRKKSGHHPSQQQQASE
jgi:hypothetical protein